MTKLKALIVDDEMGMRLGAQRALDKFSIAVENSDHEITFDTDIAGTAEEALEKIEAHPPDILLLDYKLPGMSGLDLLNTIHIEHDETAVIMITAYASLETAVSAIKQGAFDFIAKPFTPGELKSVIEKAVKNLMLARQVKKLARERHEIRFQFISVLGHELKAPINAVQGYLNLMKDETLGGDISGYAKMIDRCLIRTDGMLKLIGDLLDLTKIESGKRERTLIKQNLVDIADEAVETAAVTGLEKNITIEMHTKTPVFLTCDSSEMTIIFNNLLSNAVKYNCDNGRVDVYIEDTGEYVTISVHDTGIGLSPAEKEKLFQEFVRIKNSKTKNITGSGLGLAIVKKISAQYKGNISVNSEEGKGSTFCVTLSKKEGLSLTKEE